MFCREYTLFITWSVQLKTLACATNVSMRTRLICTLIDLPMRFKLDFKFLNNSPDQLWMCSPNR